MSTFVISDIHGEYEQLKTLLAKMNFGEQTGRHLSGNRQGILCKGELAFMKNKIIGWNINQRSGIGSRIPEWVEEELLEQKADIIVLTELYKVGNIEKFWNKMKASGYEYAITHNGAGMNEVGILWRTELYTLIAVDDSVVSKAGNNAPNLLIVDLEDRHHNGITVAGFRIRIVEHRERAKELQAVMDKVGQYQNPVIMVADGNNLRRGTEETAWNLKVMDEMLRASGFQRNTPDGSSIFGEHSDNGKAYEFAEDHIIGRNVKITMEPYDRDFVRRAPLIYLHGKDFQWINFEIGETESILPGFPDHAIVKGYYAITG